MVLKASVTHFEDVSVGSTTTKAYVINVDNNGTKWQLKKRYSEFEAFHKVVKPDVPGVIFPGKGGLFGAPDPLKRCGDLNDYMTEVASRSSNKKLSSASQEAL